MSLAILATEDNWQGFDEAWNELIQSGGPVEELLVALDVVATKRRISRCMPLIRDHAEKLAGGGRPVDAAQLLGTALRAGAPHHEIAEALWKHAEGAWGTQEWWAQFTEMSGFRVGAADLRKSWMTFDDMRSYAPGVVVFHRGGWGTGEVTELSHVDMEVTVRFLAGKKDRFPLRTAVEIFERLPDTDLRAQHIRDPDGLRQRLSKEPIEVLRSVLLRHSGKATQIMIKNALLQVGVDGSAWSSWWRRARMLAENSEWFRVSGAGQKVEIELLRRALDPVASLKRQLEHAPSLSVALSRARDIFGSTKLEENVRNAGLEVLERLSVAPKTPLEDRLSTWMLMREHRGATPQPLTEALARAVEKPLPADPAAPPPVWALLQKIPLARDQEKSVEILQEVFGDGWLDQAAANLQHASPGQVKPLVDALLAAKREDDLARQYSLLLARPMRSPFVLMALVRLAEDGRIKGDFPGPVQRAHALIELAAQLADARRGNSVMARAEQRLVELLTKGKPPLIATLLDTADVQELRSVLSILLRGVDEKLDAMVTDLALEKGVDIFKPEHALFWNEDKTWTTRRGLEKRQAELREIRDVKIPQNAETIGRAAGFGDLSENFEWAQAIEEQRHLTEQAAAIERELRQAALLENAPVMEDTVTPGTAVRYRDLTAKEEHEVSILGPWDTDRDKVISYRAPLAAGMLGLKVGGRATIELPGGRIEVEIVSVTPVAVH